MNKTFSIVDALRFGFKTATEHIVFYGKYFLIVFACTAALLSLLSLLFSPIAHALLPYLQQVQQEGVVNAHDVMRVGSGALGILTLVGAIMKLVHTFFYLGAIKTTFDFYDYNFSTVRSMLSGGHLVFKSFIANLIFVTAVAIGLGLFIIPGIWILLTYGLYNQDLVDKNSTILQAFQNSASLTRGAKLQLLGLYIVLALINFAGAMLFGLGLLITIPATLLALTYVYRKLQALPAVVA